MPGKLNEKYWWFEETGHQHMGKIYLELYGAPPVIFPHPPKSPVAGVMTRPARPPIA